MVCQVCQDLATLIVQDAEGGTKVVTIKVTGARDEKQAESVARCIAHSPLVKTALFGQDPNWGRIVAALGRSGADFDPKEVSVSIAGIPLFLKGEPVGEGIDQVLRPYIQKTDIEMTIALHCGFHEYSLLTSDLSYEYVRINAAYRS
jgi:glutamate N-acetyltransferase/amino-acid N-acetyltransferase